MIDKLKEMLRRHEAWRNKPYKCSEGKNTIGVGRNFDANPLPPDIKKYLAEHGEITDEMIVLLLDIDIAAALKDCRKLYPEFNGFTENRQVALADFLFNVGFRTASKFEVTNKAINDGRWDDAAKGLTNSRWFKQVGVRGPEVVKLVKDG